MRSNSQNSTSNIINLNNLKNRAIVCLLILFLLVEIIFWCTIFEQQCIEEHWMNHGIDSELGRSLTKINQVQEVIKGVRIIIPGSLFFSIYISNFGSPSLALLPSQFFFFITSCWCKLEIVLLSFISFLVVLYLLWYKAG